MQDVTELNDRQDYHVPPMANQDESIQSLESRIAHLEKHVEAQDAEMYQLSRRVDTLVKVAREQKTQLAAFADSGSGASPGSPADERPPHY